MNHADKITKGRRMLAFVRPFVILSIWRSQIHEQKESCAAAILRMGMVHYAKPDP